MALDSAKQVSGPLHDQLSAILQEEIASGKFQQGELFATEKTLMERFNLSSTTVRRALQDLVQKGYLYRKVGKGTFVRRPQFEEPVGLLSSFFEDMEAQGLRPSSDVLAVEVRPAPSFIAQKLQIPESAPVYFIKKLQRADGEPIAVFESYWVFKIGEVLARHDLTAKAMFRIVEERMGMKLGEAEAMIQSGAASPQEARLLNIKRGAPTLIMERVVYSTDGNPIDFARYVYRGDRYKYRARMVRSPSRLLRRSDSEPFFSRRG